MLNLLHILSSRRDLQIGSTCTPLVRRVFEHTGSTPCLIYSLAHYNSFERYLALILAVRTERQRSQMITAVVDTPMKSKQGMEL